MYSTSAKSILKRKRERAPKGRQELAAGIGQCAEGAEGLVHGCVVGGLDAGFGEREGRFVAVVAGIRLAVLMAAAVAVHIAIGSDIDEHVEAVLAAAEAAQEVVAGAA